MHKPLQQEIREAREEVLRCRDVEEDTFAAYRKAREARRIAEYRLHQARQLSEIEGKP